MTIWRISEKKIRTQEVLSTPSVVLQRKLQMQLGRAQSIQLDATSPTELLSSMSEFNTLDESQIIIFPEFLVRSFKLV